MIFLSHPLWVRGLKSDREEHFENINVVAPFVGAWIEILFQKIFTSVLIVAPFVGAWIEIPTLSVRLLLGGQSHPLWVRELK